MALLMDATHNITQCMRKVTMPILTMPILL